jgi:hypothetical protein
MSGKLSALAVTLLTENQYWLRVIGTQQQQLFVPQLSEDGLLPELPSIHVRRMRAVGTYCIEAYYHADQVLWDLVNVFCGFNLHSIVEEVRHFAMQILVDSIPALSEPAPRPRRSLKPATKWQADWEIVAMLITPFPPPGSD